MYLIKSDRAKNIRDLNTVSESDKVLEISSEISHLMTLGGAQTRL